MGVLRTNWRNNLSIFFTVLFLSTTVFAALNEGAEQPTSSQAPATTRNFQTVAKSLCPEFLKKRFTPKEIKTLAISQNFLIDKVRSLSIDEKLAQLPGAVSINAKYLDEMARISVNKYFQEKETTTANTKKNAVIQFETASQQSINSLIEDINQYARTSRDLFESLKERKLLSAEETTYYYILSSYFSFIKKNDVWVFTKLRILSRLMTEQTNIGGLTEALMLNYIDEHGDTVDADELTRGKIKYLRESPAWKSFKEFMVERVLKKWSGQLVWWPVVGPILVLWGPQMADVIRAAAAWIGII